MGAMDKFLNLMKLSDDDDGDYDDYYDEPEAVEPRRKSEPKESAALPDDEEKKKASSVKVANTQRSGKRGMVGGMEVCVVKPTSIEDGREITDTLLANRTVVLNLEGIDVEIAQRIIDFTSGSTYAIDGNLQKISHYIFIITPHSVEISGDFQEIVSGTFNVPLNNRF